MMKHGCSWNKFCIEYKSILARIQRRCGEPKPSCPLTYTDIEAYMDKKESEFAMLILALFALYLQKGNVGPTCINILATLLKSAKYSDS